jgi:transcriptional regulator PpsR
LESVRQLESQLLGAQRTSAQQNLQLREVEGRYRLLLEGSNDAVLLLDSLGSRLIEANAAGMAALGLGEARSAAGAHVDFAARLSAADRQAFEAMLSLVRAQSTAPGILLHLGPDRSPWFVRATLTTAALETVFLLRLSRAGAVPSNVPAARGGEAIDLKAVFARWPHGFVVADRDGVVLELNDAFLDLAQLSSPAMAIGSSLGRWLSRPGANAAVLLGQAARHGFVRSFPTTLHGELGTDTSIEVSIASVSHYDGQRFGVMLCDVSRRLVEGSDDLGQIVAQLTRAIGGRNLKQLTRDAVETLERHYVQQALETSGGNRTAAAELLGVSRQSLYAKLSRYGLADEAGAAGDDD